MKVSVVVSSALFSELLCSALHGEGHDVVQHQPALALLEGDDVGDALIIHISELGQCRLERVIDARRRFGVPMLLLCAQEEAAAVRALAGSQIDAVLPDDLPLSFLISSLRILQGGYMIVHRDQLCAKSETNVPPVYSKLPLQADSSAIRRLSKKEMLVLQKICDGYSNKEIANNLMISDSTVKVHLRSIFQKTQTRNRTQAAIWGREHMGDDPVI